MSLQFNPFTGTFDVTTKGDTGAVAAAGDGTAAAPGITFASDTNTGIYRPGADQLALSTNGTGRLFVDASGKVEIRGNSNGSTENLTISNLGTSTVTLSAFQYFNVFDGSSVDTNGMVGALGSTWSYGNSLPNSFIIVGRKSNGVGIRAANAPIIFSTGNSDAFFSTERLRITSTGQLSHIGAGNSGSPAVSFNGSAPSNSLVVDSLGRVSIGTTSANAILTTAPRQGAVPTASSIVTGLSLFNDQENTSGDGVQILFDHSFRNPGSQARGCFIRSESNSTYSTTTSLVFGTGSSGVIAERARITSSGQLLVGTSTDSGGSKLQINDNRIRIATAKTPASATDTGVTGEICWDANYVYVCTDTNTWKRTAIATW